MSDFISRPMSPKEIVFLLVGSMILGCGANENERPNKSIKTNETAKGEQKTSSEAVTTISVFPTSESAVRSSNRKAFIAEFFEDHRPYFFEVTGGLVKFNLQITWDSEGDMPVHSTIDTDELLKRYGFNQVYTVGKNGEPGRSYFALLIPNRPTTPVELRFKFQEEETGGRITEQISLKDILPEEAINWRNNVGKSTGGGDEYTVPPGFTTSLFSFSHGFWNGKKRIWLTYTLTATGLPNDLTTPVN